MSTNDSKIIRKQISKEVEMENNIKIYRYIYVIYKDNVEIGRQSVVKSSVKKYTQKYNDIQHKTIVLDVIRNYFKLHNLKIALLQKRSNLDGILKDLVKIIHKQTNIKLTQNQLRNVIKFNILDL